MSKRKRSTAGISAFPIRVMHEDDAPEFTATELSKRAVTWRIGDTVVSADRGRQAMRHALAGKSRVNIHLDNDVIAFFKNRAVGRGYQTLINSTLRAVMEGQAAAKDVESVVRQTIQEEFARQAERSLPSFTGVSTGDQFEVPPWKN